LLHKYALNNFSHNPAPGVVCHLTNGSPGREHEASGFENMKLNEISTFTKHYLECALWSSTDNCNEQGGEPLEANYDLSNCSPEMLKQADDDCQSFQDANADALNNYYETFSVESAGHDFWLTRNGHGAGFWDRGLGKLGTQLSDAAKVYGSVDIYVGADGKLHSN
jgi:hypothetical protein